jgi:hypothetical protein
VLSQVKPVSEEGGLSPPCDGQDALGTTRVGGPCPTDNLVVADSGVKAGARLPHSKKFLRAGAEEVGDGDDYDGTNRCRCQAE